MIIEKGVPGASRPRGHKKNLEKESKMTLFFQVLWGVRLIFSSFRHFLSFFRTFGQEAPGTPFSDFLGSFLGRGLLTPVEDLQGRKTRAPRLGEGSKIGKPRKWLGEGAKGPLDPQRKGLPRVSCTMCNPALHRCNLGLHCWNAPESATHPKTQTTDRSENLRFRVCCVFECVLAPANPRTPPY